MAAVPPVVRAAGTPRRGVTHEPRPTGRQEGELRDKVYKSARILPIIFVADGIFMVWPLVKGGYAWLTYGRLSYLPLFFPAFLVGLVFSAIYAHGFARRSWTVRKAEPLFLLLFVLAVGAKVAVFMMGRRDDQRGAAHDGVGELGPPTGRVWIGEANPLQIESEGRRVVMTSFEQVAAQVKAERRT